MSQGEKHVYVKSGSSGQQVPAGGDFIFVKETARPVRIIVDGQPIVMSRGDKRRLDRSDPSRAAFSSFEIENLSDVDLHVVLVVGEGDYESQIVTGELFVSETIKTVSMGSESMPVEHTREIGIVDQAGGRVSVGDVVKEHRYNDVEAPEGSSWFPMAGVFEYQGSVWLVSVTHISQFSTDGDLLSELELPEPFPARRVRGAAVDGLGRVFVLVGGDSTASGGQPYDGGEWGVYTLDIGSGAIAPFFNTAGKVPPGQSVPNETGTFGGRGLQIRDGKLYWVYRFSMYSAEVWELDIDTGVAGEKLISSNWGGSYFFDPMLRYDAELDLFYMGSMVVAGDTFEVVNSEGYEGIVDVIPHTEEVYLPGSGMVCGVSYASGGGDGDGALYFWSSVEIEYKAKLWMQRPGKPETRREYPVFSDVSFMPRAGGTIMVGEIVRALLEGLKVDGVVKPSYLDYVTKLKYEDGHYELEKSSGTASWAYRGYRDYGELLMDSTVTIGLLPEFLTSAF